MKFLIRGKIFCNLHLDICKARMLTAWKLITKQGKNIRRGGEFFEQLNLCVSQVFHYFEACSLWTHVHEVVHFLKLKWENH